MNPSWPSASFLPTDSPHRVAYRVVGERSGEAWLLLHGGPGAACQPGMLRPLDLSRQWAVAPDPRGAGASRPRGWTARNHTAALVADLEALRRRLGLERWCVLAGSWGTVVALAYARAHPERVERLVLRGAFAVTQRELAGLLQAGQRVTGLLGMDRVWPRAPGGAVPVVLAVLRRVLQSGTPGVARLRVVRRWNRLEMACAAIGLRRSLRHAAHEQCPALAASIRREWAGVQRGLRRARAGLDAPRQGPVDRRLLHKYRVQAHYLAHRGFVRPGALDAAVRTAALGGIAIDWVHGRFDAVCPSANSRRWAALGQRLGGEARLHLTAAGHLGHEPDTLAALRKAVRGGAGRARS